MTTALRHYPGPGSGDSITALKHPNVVGVPRLLVGGWSLGVGQSFDGIDPEQNAAIAWEKNLTALDLLRGSGVAAAVWDGNDFLVPILTAGDAVHVWVYNKNNSLDLDITVNQGGGSEPVLADTGIDVGHSGASSNIYVCGAIASNGDGSTRCIKKYDGGTGALIDWLQFGSQNVAFTPMAVGHGSGIIYVAYAHDATADILLYDETYTLLDTWTGLNLGTDIDLDEAENLYGFSRTSDKVREYNGGVLVQDFPLGAGWTALSAGGKDASVGGDGVNSHLYVLYDTGNKLEHYNATSGALLNSFNQPGSVALSQLARLKVVVD